MNPQPLIGISGRKRAGKDTLASYLVNHHGYTRLGFADALKAVMAELDPIVEAYDSVYGGAHAWRLSQELNENKSATDPTGWEHAKANPEVRRLLQVHGDAVRRNVGDHVWLDATMSQVSWMLADGAPVVIPDVRYPNEADAIRDRGGIVVRIVRHGNTDNDPTAHHISETALDRYGFDAVVHNDDSLEALRWYASSIAMHAIGL